MDNNSYGVCLNKVNDGDWGYIGCESPREKWFYANYCINMTNEDYYFLCARQDLKCWCEKIYKRAKIVVYNERSSIMSGTQKEDENTLYVLMEENNTLKKKRI